MKNSKWRVVTLGEVISLQRGYDLPEKERIEGPVPVYGSAGVTGFHNVARARGPGITLGRSGASFGVVNFPPKDYWPHNAVLFVTNFHGNVERFIYYLLKTIDFSSLNSGSAQPSLNRNYVYMISVKIPDESTQRKIASILSAYDDLIENNTRRIKILEEMAQALYREWFVKFRFPGHEKVRMMESELGMVPEGWEVKRLADFGNVITGKTPSKAIPEFFGSFMPFIKTPDMHGNIFCVQTGEYLSELGASSQKNKTLPPNSLCVSCIGTAGIVSITSVKAQTNQQINSIVLSSERYREYLYFVLMGLKEVINQYGANGATMVNLNKGKFEALNIICPDTKNISAFHDLISSHFDSIKTLQIKNANLRRTRDLLLPKLISGEVDVEKIDMRMPENGGV